MLRKNARDLEIGDNTMSYGKILTIVKNGNEVVYTCDSSAEVHTYGDVYSPCYEPGEAPFPRQVGQGVKGSPETAGEARAHRHREPAAGEQVDRRQGLRGLDRPS